MGRQQRVLINTSFKMQRVTGQQRYAHEISRRLLARDGFTELTPGTFFASSALRVWAWVMAVAPVVSRRRLLLSMTARAPLFARQVLVIHDLFVLTNPEWFSKKYVITHAPVLRYQLKRAKALVAVSQPVADQLARGYAVPVIVAPNAPSDVFRAEDGPVDTGALSSRGLRTGGYFLCVGSVDPRKNLPRLAAAYGALDETLREQFPLVVVGGGAAVFRSQEIAWPSQTVNAGYVSDEELRTLYAHAHAVVFPSLAEGFGLPLVEASAAGTPRLVVSDIPVFRWICADSAHYFDPTSVAAISKALSDCIDRPKDSPLDSARFTWERSADIVAEACDRLVNPRRARVDAPLTGAVGIASAGRAALLATVLADLERQTVTDFAGVVSVPDSKSLPAGGVPERWAIVTNTRGLAAQRNAAIEAALDSEVIFFFDDDSVVREDYVVNALDFFRTHPDVVGLTGRVIIDGASRGEISQADATAAIARSYVEPLFGKWKPTRQLYGCNFAYRLSADPAIRFDSRLPLYSWLEDHDFARRLARHGVLAKVDDCVIVHRGASSGGRTAHQRLGYSQMMNPIYLWKKGSFPTWLMAWEIFRPTAKNLANSVVGGERSWRRVRLRANAMALHDALRGRITPERITDL